MKCHRRIGLAVLVLLVGVGLASHSVEAQDLQQQQARPQLRPQALPGMLDVCANAAADATITLGPTASQVQSTSPNTSYSNDGCTRYAVNINVGQSQGISHYENNFRLQGEMASPPVSNLTQQQCSALEVNVTFYKKASGQTSFTRIGSGRYTGRWVPPIEPFGAHCELQSAAGGTDPGVLNFPATGTDVYRVTVSAKVGTAFKTVTAGAGRTPQPS